MDFLWSNIPNNQVNSLCRRTHFFCIKEVRWKDLTFTATDKILYRSLGGSSPLCAITIYQLIRWVSHNTTKLY